MTDATSQANRAMMDRDLASAALADGTAVPATAEAGGVAVELPSRDAPVAVGFDVR